MRNLLFLITLLFVGSCITTKKDHYQFKVGYKGALKNMMHRGDLSAKANLIDYKSINHLYALGAIENLKGEIQIFDSKVINSIADDNQLTFDNTFNKRASLFVYASVRKWKSIKISDSITTYEQLEIFIENSAKDNQINVHEPFPFLLNGTPKSIDWHVIDWKEGDNEHSHEKHINSGPHGTLKNKEVEMLGFYSDSHHAIFTHHTTNMHIHFKTKDNKIAGHADGLILEKGMVLKLPYNNK